MAKVTAEGLRDGNRTIVLLLVLWTVHAMSEVRERVTVIETRLNHSRIVTTNGVYAKEIIEASFLEKPTGTVTGSQDRN